jgi:hypothetical protein
MINEPESTLEPDVMDGPPEQEPRSRWLQWVAPAWFLLGVIMGVAGFAAFVTLTQPKVDEAGMREAAREGTLDAIATVQAGGSPDSRESSVPSKTTFTTRDANRLGSKTARVTIVEFSDFQ